MLVLFLLSNLTFSCSNKNLNFNYLIGDFYTCSRIKSIDTSCQYLKALCLIGLENYDDARYNLSKLSTKLNKDDDLLYLVLNSLVEIAYLTGEYEKAINLSSDAYLYCTNKSYSCLISSLLKIKANYSNKDFNNYMILYSHIEKTTDSFLNNSLKIN